MSGTPDKVITFTEDIANMRHCNGNPNTIGIGGEPGYTCQNWANGKFYVYSAGAWNEVLTFGGSSPGNVGDILWHGPSGWQHQRGIDDQDQVAVMSWDSLVRFLYDASGLVSVNFDNRTLVNNGSIESVSWNDGITVYDANSVGALAMTIGVRNIYDTAGAFSGDFSGRNLIGNTGVPVLNWNDGIGVWDGNGGAAILADSSARALYDLSATTSLDFENRYLVNGASFAVLNWTNQFVLRLNGTVSNINAPVASVGSQLIPNSQASGSTFTVASDAATVLTLYFLRTTTLAALTIQLGDWLDSVPDGSRITIFFKSAVTSLTVLASSPNGAYSIQGTAVTTVTAGQSIEYVKVAPADRTSVTYGTNVLRIR